MMMSSSSFSARRQIWSHQHPLRRQRSFIDSGLLLTHSSGTLGRTDRGKYSLLQKQFSVDHVYGKGVRQGKYNNIRCSNSKQGVVSKISNNNDGGGGNQWTVESNETSAIGLNTYQKKKIPIKGYGEVRKDKTVSDRLRKVKGSEDRINLNIFLIHTAATLTDPEGASSDLESPSESVDIGNPEKKSLPEKVPQSPIKKDLGQSKRPPSAATRRAQFKASRDTVESLKVEENALLSALPSSLTIERRTPLVRAMSAPVRTLDENSKNIFANNKRKSRRRRILTRNPSCDKLNVIDTNFDENDENASDRGRGKNCKKSSGRAKSALACDVVTLVSLISSEGSDSEKEDSLAATVEGPLRRAPLLRKTGKSVSFQENEQSNFIGQNKEYPQILRRGSIAPLAARIRANRPPTAPPVSIFIPNMEDNELKIPEENKNSSKDDNFVQTSPSRSNVKEENDSSDGRTEIDEKHFPVYLKSIKERECWKLFQKMSNKGVAVSYDTILRGLLTPTELRLLQNKKELEESKKICEAPVSKENDETINDSHM